MCAVLAANPGDLFMCRAFRPDFNGNTVWSNNSQTVRRFLGKSETMALNVCRQILKRFSRAMPLLARNDEVNAFGRPARAIKIESYSARDTKWNGFPF